MPKIKVPPRDPITPEEMDKMMERAGGKPQLMALLAVLYLTGQRISEILALRPGDITVKDDRVVFKFLMKKKRSKGALIPRHNVPISLKSPYIVDFLVYLKERVESEVVFTIDRNKAWRLIKELNPNCYLHFFRHTRLSRLAEQGATGPELMTWAGWADLRPASRYLSRSVKSIEKFKTQE